MPRGVEVLGFLFVVLLIGIAIPVLMNSTANAKNYYADVGENETQSIDGRINVTVTKANITGGYSQIKVVDHETLESEEKTIQDGENATYVFPPGNVTVGVNSTDSKGTRMAVEIPSTYGWDRGARLIGGQLPLVLGAMAVVIILFFIALASGGL